MTNENYAASQADVFNSNHKQYQARHFVAFNTRTDLTTTIYRNDFKRNWYKLNDVNGRSLSSILESPESFPADFDIIRGGNASTGALRVRANNRSYYSQGVESVLGLRFDGVSTRNQFEVGFRYHEDQEDRFQHDDRYRMEAGRMILTQRGAPGSSDNRLGDARAAAFFIQDEIQARRWTVTPGFRYENIEVVRTNYATTDPARNAPTGIVTNQLHVWIPGIGVMFDITPEAGVFGGVHKRLRPSRSRFDGGNGSGIECELRAWIPC